MSTNNFEALFDVLATYTNVDADHLDLLADWVNKKDLPTLGIQKVATFKSQLRQALDQPGAVTPQAMRRWTDREFHHQKEVQADLQHIWDTCFGQK